ncbi:MULTISPECIES: ABC transporter ATP-binding protein [Clostridium]|uniref:ABC transporter ATP-binding protein n=1 Tax=Clostridium sulfidigenes TaxID=318464 RepID=A0A084J853_9CLOT|nr:ABC transporter ATP-binding protein [Clostridium sulfidigenes]HAR84262.1 ABC transporter ATP-binding protein [Clostridium sp.]KEZ85137.1 spermidine/putrescine ABC transporter ATP-binding protein [Clostridium sulfidigenes]MBE6060962.1 ABC transporter ATP-binding protein [Clostridium sulfidigenes]HBA04998.1 ABC transporter ATP-binding protein [Clostridium sp.]HBL06875.1 ABC transporter ATP-binding protein [Clostridium sp.]
MNRIEIKNVYMNYHTLSAETVALKDINFTVDGGEFVSIVGPSGCGKSTLLNIVSGLIEASSGDILVDGRVQEGYSDKIGYMFQKDQLFEWLTVLQNVSIGLKIKKMMNDDAKIKLEKLLKNYNLWEFKDHYPRQLSGGMRQRVALIRTLALDPEVLLLDEPFSALDYQTRLNVSDEIYEIIKNEGKTAIMVTHDISEAVSMSSRVIVLSKRPAVIKKIIKIEFDGENLTPLKCREHSKFRVYFNDIWKEMDYDDK